MTTGGRNCSLTSLPPLKWGKNKLNRALRKRTARLKKQIAQNAGELKRKQWIEVCDKVDGQMREIPAAHSGQPLSALFIEGKDKDELMDKPAERYLPIHAGRVEAEESVYGGGELFASLMESSTPCLDSVVPLDASAVVLADHRNRTRPTLPVTPSTDGLCWPLDAPALSSGISCAVLPDQRFLVKSISVTSSATDIKDFQPHRTFSGQGSSSGDTMLMRCLFIVQKAPILKNAFKLKGSGQRISEDFSDNVRTVRRKLWEATKSYRSSGSSVRIVYDHVFIDDVRYSWDPHSDTIVKSHNRGTKAAASNLQ
ncbi:hypothetical protein HPB50_018621 [Hyalomma asiaticum]|uniref:Uncharacterized protein n=1 Tax=Hyalomma asiaticum TaxID=266040 RepID=A0ACB7SIK6_HYAAI|nr:hypothetical protein HPB50_018621 [Hyalomma asiaticum]